MKTIRRKILFIPGLWVEIYWHNGLSCWAAEAYSVEYDEVGNSHSEYLGASYSLDRPIERPGTPRTAVKALRLAIAHRKNPKLTAITKRLLPDPVVGFDYASVEMRFSASMLGVKLADHFIVKDVPT